MRGGECRIRDGGELGGMGEIGEREGGRWRRDKREMGGMRNAE